MNDRGPVSKRVLSILVSSTALAVMAAHLVWPSVRIDAITLGLLILAAVPWLAPLFKSIELPGGWKVEFQELKREIARKGEEVTALAGRVEKVERIAFAGRTTSDFRERVTSDLRELHGYFNRIGANLGSTFPSVRVSEDAGAVGYYTAESNTIVIGEEARDNFDLVLRLYTQHVLSTLSQKEMGEPNQYIRHALATYFPCSFKNYPSLGFTKKQAEEDERRTGHPYAHNLDHQRRLTKRLLKRVIPASSIDFDISRVWDVASIWGGALWELRTAIGEERTDAAFLRAWVSTRWADRDQLGSEWTKELLKILGAALENTTIQIFRNRGLLEG
ncbi:MAG: hypothetical protein ACM3JB_18790 [Acidobacteriaceae bacterium]